MPRLFLLAASMILASLAAASAAADTVALMPSLKTDVTITGDIVRIGDLVANAGDVAERPIFRAPDLGKTGAVPAVRVLEAVRAHGLTQVDSRGLREVVVTRPAREIGIKELEEHIVAALTSSYRLGAAADLTVTIDRDAQPLLIEPSAGEPRVLRANYDRYSGRYDVTFELPALHDDTSARQRFRYTGAIAETVEVAIPQRTFGRGEVIRAGDVTLERQPKAAVRPGSLTSLGQVVGLAARRPLRVGQALTPADVMKPEVVIKNEAVTITYEAPGMMLNVRGKALESGAEGDLITVFNAQTKRTLQGVVAGPGRVDIVTTFAAAPGSDITGSIPRRAQSNRTE